MGACCPKWVSEALAELNGLWERFLTGMGAPSAANLWVLSRTAKTAKLGPIALAQMAAAPRVRARHAANNWAYP
jgi:hypothetical protein